MKNECNIIRDLLPLYAENIASAETVEFVEEHLKTCEPCREEYEQMKESKDLQADTSAAPLIKLRRKMRSKKIQTVAVTVMLVIALFVSTFAILTAPMYFPYSKDVISVTEDEDEIIFTFNEKVTHYSSGPYRDPSVEAPDCYIISAWTTLWDKWFSNEENSPLWFSEGYQAPVYYVSNNGEDAVCIYGEFFINPNSDGMIFLPHLTLGYYFLIAVALFAILLAVRIIVRKKGNIKVWIERIMLYPISYAIAHLIVVGFSFATYSISRDFTLIICISLPLWCGMLLAHNVFKKRREIKEMSQALDEQK